MPDQAQRLVVSDLTGGRNAIDAPMSPAFRENQAVEMSNVEFWRSTFGRRRNGMSSSGVTFSAGGPFTGKISSLFRHVPGTDETLAEMWAIDSAATPVVGRKAGATTWTAPTLKDNLTGNGWDVSAASLNGLFFMAYKSSIGRLHVWDGSTVRRCGMALANAPSVANTGAGSYAATLRYYRVRFTVQSGGSTTRRGDVTSAQSTSFTPSGAGTAARITQPAVPNEGETHWEVEASVDNVTFYLLSAVAIATTTYDDSAAVSSYSSNTLSASSGVYAGQKSYRFIAADQSRLLGFGSWVAGDQQNRIEISAIVGSLSVGDAERVNTTNTYYLDLDENDSGQPTGLIGPLFGNFYAFKPRQLWELRPTGDVNRPYEKVPISKTIGACGPRAWCLGEDAQGRPCIYFMSYRGMYQYGAAGLRYVGRGIEDLVTGTDFAATTNRINLSAANVVCHMVYHTEKSQLWVWWATGSADDPNRCAIHHVKYGGWTLYTSGSNTLMESARCSVMQSRTFGAAFSRDLLPFIGDSTTNNKIYMCDDATVNQDNAVSFTAAITLKPYNPWGPGYRGRVGECLLFGENSAATITVRVLPDARNNAGDYTTGTADLTVSGTEAFASRRVENTALTGPEFVQYRVGEFAATNAAWTLHSLTVPWYREEALVA